MERVIVIYLFLVSACASPPSISKRYRTDYEYSSDTESFYKLHIDGARNVEAKSSCTAEGAKLMVPATDQDIIQLHAMLKKFPDIGDYVYVDQDGKEHESAEEQPLIDLSEPVTEMEFPRFIGNNCDVVNRKGEISTVPCFRKLPFICKVEAKDAPYDDHCDVMAVGYQYYASVGSCYKVSSVAYSWNHAYDECQTENAHLVVLNSQAEMLVVKDLINAAKPVTDAQTTYFFYAGFRAKDPAGNHPPVFRTIFNQTLEQAGFSGWSENEPNNAGNIEFCGTLFTNDGKFNDVDCSHKYAFVCEKELRL